MQLQSSRDETLWSCWLSDPLTSMMSFCVYEGVVELALKEQDAFFERSPWSVRISRILLDFMRATKLLPSKENPEPISDCWKQLLISTYRDKGRLHPLCRLLSRLRHKHDVDPRQVWNLYRAPNAKRRQLDELQEMQLRTLIPWIEALPFLQDRPYLVDVGGARGDLARALYDRGLIQGADIVDQIPFDQRQEGALRFFTRDIFSSLPSNLHEGPKTYLLCNIVHFWPTELDVLFESIATSMGERDQLVIIDLFQKAVPDISPSLYQLQLLPFGGLLPSKTMLSQPLKENALSLESFEASGPAGYSYASIVSLPSPKKVITRSPKKKNPCSTTQAGIKPNPLPPSNLRSQLFSNR